MSSDNGDFYGPTERYLANLNTTLHLSRNPAAISAGVSATRAMFASWQRVSARVLPPHAPPSIPLPSTAPFRPLIHLLRRVKTKYVALGRLRASYSSTYRYSSSRLTPTSPRDSTVPKRSTSCTTMRVFRRGYGLWCVTLDVSYPGTPGRRVRHGLTHPCW